jgi:hypothetical protein
LENLGPGLADHPVTEETFFQQDGAMSHTAWDSMAAVRNLFPNHFISRYGDITWPARSPSLSAWGYLKSHVFKAPAPHTVQELKYRIQQEFKRILMEMLHRVIGDIRNRLTECLEWNGGHLNDVVFRKYDFCFRCVKLLNWFNLLVTRCTNKFNSQQLYALPTLYFCVVYLRTNSDLCHLQHKLVGFYNRDEKYLQRGTDWAFK